MRTAVALLCLSACAGTRALPRGVAEDCFVAPCEATGDLDGDGRPDRVLLVVSFGDTEADTPRTEGEVVPFEEDLSTQLSWDLLPKARVAREFGFLPSVAGDALRMSEGDAAWVLYRSSSNEWFYAPLGY